MKKKAYGLPIEKIYQMILEGELKRFPHGTWLEENGGKDNFKRCLRFLLLEKLLFTREDIINRIDEKLLIKYKLMGGLSEVFKQHYYESIDYSFPELKIRPWELRRTPANLATEETIVSAIRWLFLEKLKWDREKIISGISYTLLVENGLFWVVKHFPTVFHVNDYIHYHMINIAVPELEVSKEEYRAIRKQTETISERVEEFKNFVENELGLRTKQDIMDNLYFYHFDNAGVLHYVRYFGSLTDALQTVYPEEDWTLINERKAYISEETKYKIQNRGPRKFNDTELEEIFNRLESGHCVEDIANFYGVNPHTIYKYLKGETTSNFIKEKLNQYYSVAEAAKLMGLSEVTVKSYCRGGKLKAVKFSKKWKIYKNSVEEYKNNRIF